jgi:hypothetical protein
MRSAPLDLGGDVQQQRILLNQLLTTRYPATCAPSRTRSVAFRWSTSN